MPFPVTDQRGSPLYSSFLSSDDYTICLQSALPYPAQVLTLGRVGLTYKQLEAYDLVVTLGVKTNVLTGTKVCQSWTSLLNTTSNPPDSQFAVSLVSSDSQCCALGPPSGCINCWKFEVDSKAAAVEQALQEGVGFNANGSPVSGTLGDGWGVGTGIQKMVRRR